MTTVFERLTTWLDANGVEYSVLEHEPVYTSEEAAAVRGTSLSSGAKALVCKADSDFIMFVMPANKRLASKSVRKAMGLRSLRFAKREEVMELTGLKPGSIPPFGSLFDLTTHCDAGLANEATINFNAGDHARSVSMSYQQYASVETPTLGEYAE